LGICSDERLELRPFDRQTGASFGSSQMKSRAQQGGEVVGGVPPWFLGFIHPWWGYEFGDTIWGENDRPVAFMDFGVMVSTQETPIAISTFAVV